MPHRPPGRSAARPGRWGTRCCVPWCSGAVWRALFWAGSGGALAFVGGAGLSWRRMRPLSVVLTVEVEGNEAVSTAEILTELRRQGLRPGVYGPGLDEGTISSAALLGLPELAWMSVNLHGIRAEVLVREAVPAPEVDDEEQVGSIVARSSGIVTHIEPLSGEALVAQGDTVLAGEVLISGAVTLDAPQYSELENLGQILVRAQGQVFARTWHTMTASIPLEAQVKSYTGEKASRWTLSILGHRIDFFGKSGISFPEYDKIADAWALTLPGGGRCPGLSGRPAGPIPSPAPDADAAERLLEEGGCWSPSRGWLQAARWCIPASPSAAGWTAGGA
ncbi:MAG: sporulation protein YqfD [Flavonifractor plautii]